MVLRATLQQLTLESAGGKMVSASSGRHPHQIAGVTQLVECDLAKVDVAGSNPVSRSILSGRIEARRKRAVGPKIGHFRAAPDPRATALNSCY